MSRRFGIRFGKAVPPLRYMFAHALPRFRKLGLEEAAIGQMMVTNPARTLPVR